MSVWVKYEKITDADALVQTVHYVPDELSKEIKAKGVMVEFIPNSITPDDKIEELHINPVTLEMWYVYKDIIPTKEEELQVEVAELKAQNAQILLAVAELSMMIATP